MDRDDTENMMEQILAALITEAFTYDMSSDKNKPTTKEMHMQAAQLAWDMYEAFVRVGFSDDQAMTLIGHFIGMAGGK